jgi:hypothetical protein
MSPRRRERAALSGLALCAALFAVGCTDDITHVFGAYRYEEGPDCLEAAAAIDVIEGKDPGTCPSIRCWMTPADDVYVTSTACDAPPDYADHTSDPPASGCGRALAAFARAGHSPCPIPPDAGN